MPLDMVEQVCESHEFSTISRHRRKETNSNECFSSRVTCIPFLIWFFVICRFSTLLLCPASANPLTTSDDLLRVKELDFSDQLENPCRLAESATLQTTSLQMGSLSAEDRRTVMNDLKAKVQLLNDFAPTILRKNIFQECVAMRSPLVATVPTALEISGSEAVQVLRLFYNSLLNHTAHVYFVSNQLQKYGETCNNAGLLTTAKDLAEEMRQLTCMLKLAILTLSGDNQDDSYFSDSTSQILNEMLEDQPMCSRRSVRYCRTISSTVRLLSEMASYLHNRVLIEDEHPS